MVKVALQWGDASEVYVGTGATLDAATAHAVQQRNAVDPTTAQLRTDLGFAGTKQALADLNGLGFVYDLTVL